jgi:hypothetical protein
MEKTVADKDHKDLKSKLKFYREDNPSFIVMIVVHQERERNDITRLSCKRLIPLDGYPTQVKVVPVGGYVYDAVTDSYVVNCIDYFPVGFIPFSFRAKMEGVGHWSIPVPFTENVVRRYLNPGQKADLEKFKQGYADSQFEHQFIQFISS